MLDDDLLTEAIAIVLSGLKTKKDVISLALKEFVVNRKRKNILDLSGKISFRKNYDYKKMREE